MSIEQSKSSTERQSEFEFEVPAEHSGERADVVLCELLNSTSEKKDYFSRSKITKWIADGLVTVNDAVVTKAGLKVFIGEVLSVIVPQAKEFNLTPDSSVVLNFVYEDDDVAVIDKPANLVVHPGAGNESGTLVHGLLARFGAEFSSVGHPLRPGIVHRLDKDTSGLMVVAKSQIAYHALIKQFIPPRSVSRTYLALVARTPKRGASSGIIDLPISRHAADRKKMSTRFGHGKEAVSHWTVAEELKLGVLLEVSLETGRTHQIRVHLHESAASIIGDQVYGANSIVFAPDVKKAIASFGRQALHAAQLSFVNPIKNTELSFSSQMPTDMAQLVEIFRSGTCKTQ